jgi:CDGSH iron-sulfur domain-containing protein 3
MSDQPKAHIAQKAPFVLQVEAGKTYAWCACGHSSKQPFCDGSHLNTGFKPVLKTFEEDGKVAWCGCKHSAKGTFCDGTHKQISEQ